MKVITLMNEKGGVGKTTVSTHIACGLAKAGKQNGVIMTDNVQAHLYGVEYTRPEQMKFTKERVKATEQEIREAWGGC